MTGKAGKIAFWRRAAGPGSLALDFAPDAISLHARVRGREWEEVGRAPTDADDFARQVDALRVEAMVRDRTQSPITLWLPSDQIIERRYQLAATSDDGRRTEAARRIASETTHLAAELSVAVSDGSRTEPVKVLAVLLQTMIEARSYAANWGFNPGPISTRVSTDGFGADGPVFEFPRSVAHKAGRSVRRIAVAAVALGTVGAAALGGYQLVQPLLQEPIEVRSTGPAPSSFAVFLDPPPGPQEPFRAVEITPAGDLGPARQSLTPERFEPGLGTLDYARIGPATELPTLDEPAGTIPLRVGTAPARPEIGTPGGPVTAPETPDLALSAATTADGTPPAPEDEPEDLSPTEYAPETMALVPPRRPDAEEADAEPAVAAAPAADAEETADAPEVPPEKPEDIAATATAPEETTADAEDTPPVVEERPSVFAAAEAPEPSKRPRALQFAAKRLPARTSTPFSVYLPRSVSEAAGRTGLSMDETSVIGIIDAKSGRQALVRLADGAFRKVGRGDEIDGWRVSSISREAVRLTRNGQNRTLLLVAD